MFLDQYLENRLGPQLWQGVNPNYRLENKMDTTEFSGTFKGKKEEATDKVYFRKADEVVVYAEEMFRLNGVLDRGQKKPEINKK